MIAILPASIEAYLKDAKFSTTEVLVIRKLLEEDALTLRELATKTGKSTGVLDQSLKKLLGKGIVNKQPINGGFKYTMGSLKPILEWMEKDMKQKYEMLERRHQNFEAFIESLSVDKARPEMQYFDGEEGIKRAYIKLLDSKLELLCYWPHECNWEEHPMRDFYVQYFRERHRRNIFSRVISHDTPFGRRFQSRDPFEYRKTVLVPQDAFPIPFEKVIAGDVVACFDHKKQQACFIKYPDFTHAERMLFENHWKEAQRKQAMPGTIELEEAAELAGQESPLQSPEIELRTRVLSQLRDFFLSKTSIVSFGVFLAIAGAITFGLYKQNEYLNLQRMREQVASIAATGALQFQLKDIEALTTQADVSKAEYAKVIGQLNQIRSQNRGVKYIYLLRPTGQGMTFEFIADADSLEPSKQKDDNADGIMNEADENVTPGQPYDVSGIELLQNADYQSAVANTEPYTDQWGTFVTGYAPIKDSAGEVRAILAVDRLASDLAHISSETFAPLLVLLGIFVLFVFIRFASLHQSLMAELGKIASIRNLAWSLLLCAILGVGGSYVLHKQTEYLNLQRLREQVKSIAATGALQFDYQDLEQVRVAADISKPEYKELVKTLNNIRRQNIGIEFAYIMRLSGSGSMFSFVADADSLDPSAQKDLNEDGRIDAQDSFVSPGQIYNSQPESLLIAWNQNLPTADSEPETDQWGTFISGFGPIRDSDGKIVALLGVDKLASEVNALSKRTSSSEFLLVALIFLFCFLNANLIRELALRRFARRFAK